MNLSPFLASPVLIDPSTTTFHAWIGGESGATGLAQAYVPFLAANGLLYCILQGAGAPPSSFTPPGGISVRRSVDNGATWTVLDALNAPVKNDAFLDPIAGFYFDGVSTIIVASSPTASPTLGTTGPLNLQNFSCVSNTWGPIYGVAGAPNVLQINQCFQRPDGSIIVLTNSTVVAGNLAGLTAHVYTPLTASWASFLIDTNLPVGQVSNANCAVVMDSAGRLHVFGISQNVALLFHVFYQSVNLDNSLGTFAIIQTHQGGSVSQYMQPAISGDNVLIGLVDVSFAYVTMAIGTPLSGPAFTIVGAPGIDPVGLPAFSTPFAPVIAADATGIYAAYIIQLQSGAQIIRLLGNPNVATPAVGWNNSIVAFNTDLAPPGFITGIGFLGIARQNGNLFGTFNNAQDNFGPSQPTQFWLGTFSPAPAVANPPVVAPVGGLPATISHYLKRRWAAPPFTDPTRGISPALHSPAVVGAAITAMGPEALQDGVAIGGCRKLNDFDACVLAEIVRVRRIRFPPLCVMPAGYDPYAMPWDEDFGAVPFQAVPFNKNGGITTPLPGDQIVFSFRVPTAYDGLLTGLYFQYSGAGFLQGSGDIIFRVRLNQRYLKDLSNIPYLLGTSKQPVSMTQGTVLLSGQLVSLIVNVPNLSGNIQVGQSTVSGGLIGFWWPRG